MPWLSRSSSLDGTLPKPLKQASASAALNKDADVTFIPAMLDGSCGTSPAEYTDMPYRLFLGDVKVFTQNIGCIPKMFMSAFNFKGANLRFDSWVEIRDIGIQCVLAIIEIWAFVIAIPLFLSTPGIIFLTYSVTVAVTITSLSWFLKSERITRTKRTGSMQHLDRFTDERWIYINGSSTSYWHLRSQLAGISKIFRRQIVGVHNRSNGLLVDLFESQLTRYFGIATPVSMALHSQLRDSLLNTSIRKVIVLSHGQGAAILSRVLDKLHADLPVDVLSKLEIYTFGSAASHLSNPCLAIDRPMNQNGPVTRADGNFISPVKATLASRGYRTEDTERVITHIEHYAMSTDIFARCGILHNTFSVLDNRFCGRVFVINNRSGFLFTSHYLDAIFPSQAGYDTSNPSLLDTSVVVDVATAEKREFTAQGILLPLKSISRRQSDSSNSSATSSPNASPKGRFAKSQKRSSWDGLGLETVEQARRSAREAEGKTVRQLSRLWRYANGARPVGEGVSMTNGVGLDFGGPNRAPFGSWMHDS